MTCDAYNALQYVLIGFIMGMIIHVSYQLYVVNKLGKLLVELEKWLEEGEEAV